MIKQIPWVNKYSPSNSAEVRGQDKGVAKLKEFVIGFKSSKRKALILNGPTGSGKTCSVHALGKELGLEVIEINSSDSRNKEQIGSIIGEASRQMSLFCPAGKIILVDEIDGVSGSKDRGGVPELVKVIDKTAFPIVMTCNDAYNKKFKGLRKVATIVDYDEISFPDMLAILKRIVDAEKIEYEEDALKMLARRVGGDGRAGVNDLQIMSSSKKLTKEGLEMLGERARKEEITTALTKIFKTTDPMIAKTSFDTVDEDLKECMLWVDHNLPKEYTKPDDLARAYDYLSKVDIMQRRIMRRQHWRFLVYVNDYLSAGVAVSKDEKYKVMINYEQTKRLLSIWMKNRKYMKRLAISEKIADKTHSSKKMVVQDVYPYVKEIIQNGKGDMVQQLIDEFELDKEEIAYLRK